MRTNFNDLKTQKSLVLGFRIHFLAFLIITPLVWLVWYLTNSNYPWPIWSTLAWGIGVLFHYLGVFVFRRK